ncbi:MAG: type II secretion system major pseudopilin GspG [bacterium]|nr:type II secretion system major pseudopilin GspG [bacterium]
MKHKKYFAQPGVSFIEILIVIVIMAGIAALVGPALFSKLDESKIDTAKIQMKSLASTLELYRLDNHRYPSTEQGLDALVHQPTLGQVPAGWRGPYLSSKQVPKDPWGNDYAYRSEGSTFELESLGADGARGGDGLDADISFE